MTSKTKAKPAARHAPVTAVVPAGADTGAIFRKLDAVRSEVAAAGAVIRTARKIVAAEAHGVPPLANGEREIAPNVWARIEGRELILTIPLEDALEANPPVDGHAVIATAGSRFGALPLNHKGLRLNLYLAMGSAKKPAAK